MVILSLKAANFLSAMPRTFFISSIDLNAPFCSRYSIILCANAGPIPLSVASRSASAVFMFTRSLEVGADMFCACNKISFVGM